MLHRSKGWGIPIFLLTTLTFVLACSLSTGAPPTSEQPAFDTTKAALELEATAMSLQLTQSALDAQAQAPTQPPPTQGTSRSPSKDPIYHQRLHQHRNTLPRSRF